VPDTGDSLCHFRLVEKIGEGGVGDVWKAVDTRLDREVAIKILPPTLANDPERLARFKAEAKVVAALNHPNIVTIHSVEESEGIHFLSMELVHGTTLADHIPRGGMVLGEYLDIALRSFSHILDRPDGMGKSFGIHLCMALHMLHDLKQMGVTRFRNAVLPVKIQIHLTMMVISFLMKILRKI